MLNLYLERSDRASDPSDGENPSAPNEVVRKSQRAVLRSDPNPAPQASDNECQSEEEGLEGLLEISSA